MTLRDLRERLGLSQPQLAMRAGVSISTIWRAEQGKPITALNKHRIANILGVDTSEIDEFRKEESNDSTS